MPKTKKRKGGQRRAPKNQYGVGTTLCKTCGKSIQSSKIKAHQGQCKKKQLYVEQEENIDWMQEDDELGFFGPEESVDEQSQTEKGLDNNKDQNQDTDNNKSTSSGGNLSATQPDEPPIGRYVKYGFRENWMSCLRDEDSEDEDEESKDDENRYRLEPDEEAEIDQLFEKVPDENWLTHQDDDDASIEAVAKAAQEPDGLASGSGLAELREGYGNITTRGDYTLKQEWCSDKPDINSLPEKAPLRKILASKVGATLGMCYTVAEREPVQQLEDKELSMVRLINYCDLHDHNSRCFVDKFLDLLAEEISVRKFDPFNRPKRETVSRKVMSLYGEGCAPTVTCMTLATEDRAVILQEETLPQEKDDTKHGKRKAGCAPPPQEKTPLDVTEEEIAQSNAYKAIPKQIDNRERFVVDVISFNARKMILDLLSDTSIFGNLNNLVVNRDNPFLPYRNTSGYADEILDGSWYSDTLHRLKEYQPDPFREEVEFVLPLVMYVDKTGTSINQRYPLEPFIFTTAIIKRKHRIKPKSWRPLGFIPDLETKSSAEKTYINKRNRGATSQAYHLSLETILKSVEEVQMNGILHWLEIGGFAKKVRIIPELCCVINDGKSADQICQRVPSTHACRRISRSCETLQENADQPTVECKFLEINERVEELFRVVGMSEKEVQEDAKYLEPETGDKPTDAKAKSIVEQAKIDLDKLSFHPVRNAFLARCLRFGLDPRNIWGANPVDLMHAFQSGILMYLVKMILENLPPRKQVELDRLVHKLFHCLRSKERESYPRLNFSKGFSKLTLLTSDEWAGKLFVLLVVLHTEEGRELFDSAKTFDDKRINVPKKWWDLPPGEATKEFEELANQLHNKEHPEACMKEVYKVIPRTEEEEAALTKKVEQLGKDSKKKALASDAPEEMLRKCSARDFTEVAESLLCFHAWYKLGATKMGDDGKPDTSLIRESVARMLAMVRWYTPRKKANGWKLQKFHDLLHLALDIQRFGAPANFDAGPMESGLKYWAKLPATTSQMRGYNTFAKQVASRTYEFQCFAKALRTHGLLDDDPGIDEEREDDGLPHLGGTRYRVFFNPPDGVPVGRAGNGVEIYQPSQAIRKKNCQGAFAVSPVVENFLRFQPKGDHEYLPRTNQGNKKFWELRTEVSLVTQGGDGKPERITLRCHPNYRNEGAWYDWVIVNFQTDVNLEEIEGSTQYPPSCLPCKVLAIAENPKKEGDIWVLVHGCEFRNSESVKEDTVLLERWELAYHNLFQHLPKGRGVTYNGRRTINMGYMAPHLSWIKCDAIVARCLVVEEEPGIFETAPWDPKKGRYKKKVTLVRARKDWPDEFT